jgi:hypothetical protein
MNRFTRKTLALTLALALVLTFIPTAFAANTPEASAAEKLHTLGMLAGTGTNPDGSVNFELGASINRAQAVTLIINLLGKYEEATSQTWETPFTDVPGWALPFVGYAYANQITAGTSETTFGSANPVLPKQYLTFVLNALGYEPGVDFTYDNAWEKSDALGFTDGRFNAQTTSFLRGDGISVTFDSLSAVEKSTGKPLFEKLIAAGIFTKDLAEQTGLKASEPSAPESQVVADIKAGNGIVTFGDYTWKVLSVEGDKALLISEKIIDVRAYNDDVIYDITWETSSLRKYLNEELLKTFSTSDQDQILTTHLDNAYKGIWGLRSGNDTDDKIFLLSTEEAQKYLTTSSSRVAKLTPEAAEKLKSVFSLYNKSKNEDDEWLLETLDTYDNAWWWNYRSIGDDEYIAVTVDYTGSIHTNNYTFASGHVGVRPALYINLNP